MILQILNHKIWSKDARCLTVTVFQSEVKCDCGPACSWRATIQSLASALISQSRSSGLLENIKCVLEQVWKWSLQEGSPLVPLFHWCWSRCPIWKQAVLFHTQNPGLVPKPALKACWSRSVIDHWNTHPGQALAPATAPAPVEKWFRSSICYSRSRGCTK